MLRAIACAGMLIVACTSCSTYRDPSTDYRPVELPQAPRGNFTLYVSNQSYAAPLVDILVYLDGKRAVAQGFDVGEGQSWMEFRFDLEPGEHQLRAESVAGQAEFVNIFPLEGRKWAALAYQYHPESRSDGEPVPRGFTFELRDEPWETVGE